MALIESAHGGPHRRRRAAVRRHRRRQQAQGDPGEGARRPLDRREHLHGGLRGADAPPHRAGLGLHGVGRVEVQGVRLREPGRFVPLRAGGLGAHAAVHRGRHPRVVPHVRREPQPRRRRQRRERRRRRRHARATTSRCARQRACPAPTCSSTRWATIDLYDPDALRRGTAARGVRASCGARSPSTCRRCPASPATGRC